MRHELVYLYYLYFSCVTSFLHLVTIDTERLTEILNGSLRLITGFVDLYGERYISETLRITLIYSI